MDNVDQKALLEEYKYLTNLLEMHEASKKEEEIKSSTVLQNYRNSLPQKLNKNHPSHLPYKLIKNSTQSLTSFDKKYSFKKLNSHYIADHNQRTVLNKNFKAKYELSKNQPSKYFLPSVKSDLKSIVNRDSLFISKRTVLCPENKFDKTSTAISPDKPGKRHSATQFVEDVVSVTEQLKKKYSENKLLNYTAKNESNIQNKLLASASNNKKYNYSACNVKYENIFPKTKNFPRKVIAGNASSSLNNRKLSRNCYTKLNPNNKSEYFTNLLPPKHSNHNKFSYIKVDSEINSIPLNTVENKDQTKSKKIILGSHVRKVTYSDSKIVPENSCLPSNAPALTFKPLSPGKQNLTINLNVGRSTIFLNGKLCKGSPNAIKVKSPSFLKLKSPRLLKSSKVSKIKPASTRYIKINKCLTTPNKSVQLKKVHKTAFSTEKFKRNVNTKYKVINKTLTPCLNKNTLNSLNNTGSKENSPIVVDESDSFFQKLNDSTIDKLEQDLLAISTALTSTPLSSETGSQHLHAKLNSTKKMPSKKTKSRISKYKIVNSDVPQSYIMKKEHNFANLKTGFKNVNYSKFHLVKKHLQPVHALTPVKQGKAVLVKRLFKSKNTIINKNTSPISYSAKMIKYKYLALNKRKLPGWQKHTLYTKVPSHHQKFKGHCSKAKLSSSHNRYQKIATSTYHLNVVRKFPSYGYPVLNRQFSKKANRNKYKRKLKSGYVHSPVVFIHGMRYSLNSSGKTLKKLPAKGQTTKTLKRIVIGGKTSVRTPENIVKISPSTTSNLASRVLHRSINRILSASTKKSLTKVNTYCMFYNRFGRCNRGVKCTYIHDPSKIAVCTRFLRGTCKIDRCPFSHEIAPGKMAICSFFLVGACEKENCPYRHEKLLLDALLCKAFVQGYCPNGKECKKAHILICPRYIQGDCDKGNSCAFPHPPRKVKKTVQKEEEEDEKKKPDDILLEKVSRYFLQAEDCLSLENKSSIVASQFVPKQRRRLEEQPSFIPLFDSPVVSHNS